MKSFDHEERLRGLKGTRSFIGPFCNRTTYWRAPARACGAALAVSLLLSCSSKGVTPSAQEGSSGQGHGGNGIGGGGSGTAGTMQCTPGASLAPARLMLITDNQYRNIMRDAFGVTFPTDMNVTSPRGRAATTRSTRAGKCRTTLQAYGHAAVMVPQTAAVLVREG